MSNTSPNLSVLLPMGYTPSRSWAKVPVNGAGAYSASRTSFASLEVNTGTRIFICSANIVSGLHHATR